MKTTTEKFTVKAKHNVANAGSMNGFATKRGEVFLNEGTEKNARRLMKTGVQTAIAHGCWVTIEPEHLTVTKTIITKETTGKVVFE